MKYIKGFDGLRAISIVFVLLTHLGIYSWLNEHPFLERNYNLFSGSTGVMIFFTISGFLITILLLNEKKSHGYINLKLFFIRRFLKLAPPLILFLASVFILMLFNFLPTDYLALLFSFFYLYNFIPVNHYTGELGHTWSLGVEEQFYLLWPFVLQKIKKQKNGLIISIFVVSICFIFNTIHSTTNFTITILNFWNKNFYLERWFIPACMPIMIGSFAGLLLSEYENYFNLKIKNNYLFFTFSLFLYSTQIVFPNIPNTCIQLLQPVGISFLLLWIYCNQNNLLVKLMETKPISFLGKISYGLYIYQGLFLRTGPSGNLWIQSFPFNIVFVILVATLSYFFIEKRFLEMKERYKKRLDQNA